MKKNEIRYGLGGRKGARVIVREVPVGEGSFEAIENILSKSEDDVESYAPTLLEDTYNVFGGNCYKETIRFCVFGRVLDIINALNEKHSIKTNDGYDTVPKVADAVTDILMPPMLVSDEQTIYFFNDDKKDVLNGLRRFIADDIVTQIMKNIYKRSDDNTPAGEKAFMQLLYCVSAANEIDMMNEHFGNEDKYAN